MSAFPNEYTMRLVADADSKPCAICYKPTSTVLVAANKGDFFYVCPMHLKDPALAAPVHPESYTQLLSDKKALEEQIRKANITAEKNRPYSWNKLASTIGFTEKETEKGKNKEEKETDKDKEKGKEEKSKISYQDYIKQANSLKKELEELSATISNFSFKKYTLNSDFYKARVNAKMQGALRAKRQQEIQSGTFFPSAPTSKPGST